jgi:flagellar biosynthesis/type III secretory pathway chaperone
MIPVASLVETLVDVLDKEGSLYEKLLGLSGRKTTIIIKGDLKALAEITDEEQCIISDIQAAEKERVTAMTDIANVLNMDVNSLKLTDLIKVLEKRPADQKNLALQRDRLVAVAGNVRRVNGQNQELLRSSIEMVQFEMNILQQAGSAPETANYDKTAGTMGSLIGTNSGRFDARQ